MNSLQKLAILAVGYRTKKIWVSNDRQNILIKTKKFCKKYAVVTNKDMSACVEPMSTYFVGL